MLVVLIRRTSILNAKSIGTKLPEIRARENRIFNILYLCPGKIFEIFFDFVRIMLGDVWDRFGVSPMALPGH